MSGALVLSGEKFFVADFKFFDSFLSSSMWVLGWEISILLAFQVW